MIVGRGVVAREEDESTDGDRVGSGGERELEASEREERLAEGGLLLDGVKFAASLAANEVDSCLMQVRAC